MDLLFGSRLPLVLVNYQQTDKKTDKQIDDLVTAEYSYSYYTYFPLFFKYTYHTIENNFFIT